MSQDEPFRQLAQNFRQHATDENEKLKARYESTDDTWHFDGSHLSERTFRALAREGGLHLSDDASPEAWRRWLDALLANEIEPVGPNSSSDPANDGTQSPSGGPEAKLIDRLFSRSALLCLEWATEITSRIRMIERVRADTPDGAGAEGEEMNTADGTNDEIAAQPGEGWSWAVSPFPELESPDDAEQRLKENVRKAFDLIEEAINMGLRKDAVRFWLIARQFKNLKDTKSALYEEAGQDKADYYRWERGELPDGSQADRDIRRVLRSVVE